MILTAGVRRLAILAIASTFTLPVAWADRTKITLKPGGALTLDYGRPGWHDDLEEHLAEAVQWRFGANSPTVLRTDAGLVFDGLVVFPGEYNLGATHYPSHQGQWALQFHHDGYYISGETSSGTVHMREQRVDDDEAAKRFLVEFVPQEGAGRYLFRATYGPRRIEAPFTSAKAAKAKGKAGRVGFTSIYLLVADQELLQRQVDSKAGLGVAQLSAKKLDAPLRLILHGGDTPRLMVRDRRPAHVAEPIATLTGQVGELAKPVDVLEHKVKSGKEGAELSFSIGDRSYHFTLPESVFKDATRGR